MKFAVTLKQLRSARACIEGYNKVVRMLQARAFSDIDKDRGTYIRFAHKAPISLVEVLSSNGIDDALWCLRCVPDCERDVRFFAVWCANQVKHLIPDALSINALNVDGKFANGHTEDAARDAARDAAWDAARAAARDAAWDAARDAAIAAAWDAARAAAARADAWDAAWDAARDAARAAQASMFIAMCNGLAPWQKVPIKAAA